MQDILSISPGPIERHNNDIGAHSKKIGVILMTYGSATTAEYVREYMEHIYHGKADGAVIKDFEERYRLVGHSPLVEITEKQVELLGNFLNNNDKNRVSDEGGSPSYIVRAGMLHSKPFIENAIRDCKNAGAERLVGIILSPQFSSFIMDGYRAAFERAGEANGFTKGQMIVAEPWPTESHFVQLLSARVRASLEKLEKQYHATVPVIFTTHSLPARVVEKDPGYLEQLKATTGAVLKKLGDDNAGRSLASSFIWYSAYQSAGHTPEEWLKPDLTDILAEIKSKKNETSVQVASAVLIVPVQFLADHLEILYDLDIAAREQCEEFGIDYHRIELPNIDKLFIEALVGVATTSLKNSKRFLAM